LGAFFGGLTQIKRHRVLPFILQGREKIRSPFLKFSRKPVLVAPKPWRRRAKKNSENFDVLQSHNLLSERCLQKTVEASIYKNAENSENFDISQSHNLLSERHLQKPL
jgi:hypothetical protein